MALEGGGLKDSLSLRSLELVDYVFWLILIFEGLEVLFLSVECARMVSYSTIIRWSQTFSRIGIGRPVSSQL